MVLVSQFEDGTCAKEERSIFSLDIWSYIDFKTSLSNISTRELS